MHTISSNYPHTKSYIQAASPITEAQLPYALTREYQMRIARISLINANTGNSEKQNSGESENSMDHQAP